MKLQSLARAVTERLGQRSPAEYVVIADIEAIEKMLDSEGRQTSTVCGVQLIGMHGMSERTGSAFAIVSREQLFECSDEFERTEIWDG